MSSSQAAFVFRQTESIREKYRLGAQIGQAGQYGIAREATCLATGEHVAVKIMSKARFQRLADRSRHYEMMRQEIEIMKTLDHPNIIKLFDVFEDGLDLYLVMELCNGGELFDQIEQRGSFSEQDASNVLYQIVQALAYLHKHKIVHLDLKPDNFLFKDKDENARIKMIDFGMASTIHPRQHLSKLCGTPYYIAPEVIDRHYNEACDMWSVGVVMFVMLFGFPPFWVDPAQYGKHADEAIFKLIKKGFLAKTKAGFGSYFPASIKVSDSAKDLIGKLLSTDVADRLTAEEALEHPWLRGETASSVPLEDHVRSNFVKFHNKNKFRAAILGTMTDALPKEKIQELKEIFEKVDLNHDGTLTVSELAECLKQYPATEIQELVSTMDLDGDGTINYDELLKAAIFRRVGAKEERLWRSFQKLDVNHDGSITVEELRQALGNNNDQDTEELIKEADINHDGVVDYSEFLRLFDQEIVDALEK